MARMVASWVQARAPIDKPGSGWLISGKGEANVNCNQGWEPRWMPIVGLRPWTYTSVRQWTECEGKQEKWRKEEADRGWRVQLEWSEDTGAAWCSVVGCLLHLPPSSSHPFSCVFLHLLYYLDNCSCFQVVSHRDTPKALPTFNLVLKTYIQFTIWGAVRRWQRGLVGGDSCFHQLQSLFPGSASFLFS